MMARLQIKALTYLHYAAFSLSLESAECIALTGPSGSGKTLLLRAIADLDPHQGTILLDGVACHDIDAPLWRRQVALLCAESQWWYEQVSEHFSEPIDVDQLACLGFDKAVMKWAVSRLSSGERQRLALLRALENRPKVLLLDEPTGSLDQDNAVAVEALIADYRKNYDAAVIWVTHDMAQAERVADRVFVMNNGMLQMQGKNRG